MANFKKIIAVALAVVLFSSAAYCNDIFMAKNIHVDVTDRNSEIARSKALVKAHTTAFHKILNRIVKAEDIQYLPEFSAEEIGYLLREVSVVKESTSPLRYTATLNVSFDEEKIQAILAEMGISFVLSPAKTNLILPFYEKDGDLLPFRNNPWQRVWSYSAPDTALTPLKVTGKEAIISFADLDKPQLKQLAKAYDTEGVVIAYASKNGTDEIKLRYNKYINGNLMERYEQVFPITHDDENAALREMANYIANRSESSWREKMSVNVGDPILLVIVVPIQNLAHLNEISEKLKKIPLIARFELKAVKKDRAQINIWHSAEFEELKRAFRKQKLSLADISENVYGVRDLTVPLNSQKIELSPDDKKDLNNFYQQQSIY